MGRELNQYDIVWVSLDPTQGSEIAKTRPCVVVSPDELNRHLRTLIVAPLTSTIKEYPYRVNCVVGAKKGSIALDQIRTIDKKRVCSFLGKLSTNEVKKIQAVLKAMFC